MNPETEVFEKARRLVGEYPPENTRKATFNNPLLMSYDASRVKNDHQLLKVLDTLVSDGDDEKAIQAAIAVYDFWLDKDDGPNTPATFLQFLIAQDASDHIARIAIEEVSAIAAFRSKTGFWEALVSSGVEPAAYGPLDSELKRRLLRQFLGNQASIERRKGDASAARATFNKLNDLIDEHLELGDQVSSEFSFVLYELAYAEAKEGNFERAIEIFSNSAEVAFDGNDPVGGAISKCVEFNFRHLTGRCESWLFESVLRDMEKVFQQNKSAEKPKHGHARRWISNCWFHLLDIATDEKSLELAQEAHPNALENWREYNVGIIEEFEEQYTSMLRIVEGNFDEAIELLEAKLERDQSDLERFPNAEAKSRIPYYLGVAFLGKDDVEKAGEWFRKATAFNVIPGNHIWKSRAETALEALKLKELSSPYLS